MDANTLKPVIEQYSLLVRGRPGSGAIFDPLGTYRYALWREWDDRAPACNWIMLNPSTADEDRNDATIRRCIGFAKQAGHGGIVVTNLFAYRATEAARVRHFGEPGGDPIGGANDEVLRVVARNDRVTRCVAAWGTNGGYQERDRAVMTLLSCIPVDCWCLGTTQAGYPKHPVRLAGATEFIEYKGRPDVRRRA